MAARLRGSMRWFSLCETMFHLIVLPSLNELQLVVCQWASDGPIRNRLDLIISKAIESIDYFLPPDFDGFHSTKHGTQIHTSD